MKAFFATVYMIRIQEQIPSWHILTSFASCSVSLLTVDFNLFALVVICAWTWGCQPFSAKTSVQREKNRKNNSPSETGPIVCPSMTSRSTPRELRKDLRRDAIRQYTHDRRLTRKHKNIENTHWSTVLQWVWSTHKYYSHGVNINSLKPPCALTATRSKPRQ